MQLRKRNVDNVPETPVVKALVPVKKAKAKSTVKKSPPKQKQKKTESPAVAEGVKDVKEAIVDLTKKTGDNDYSYYLSRLKKNRDWKGAHKKEVKEYNEKHLALPGIKEKYNKRRREAWAELKNKGPKVQRGRPRKDFITYHIDALEPMKAALGAQTVNVAAAFAHHT